jgi:CHAT domain-containing protein
MPSQDLVQDVDVAMHTVVPAHCPLCGTAFDALRWQVVDVDRDPARLLAACDGSLQRSFCPQCIGPGVDCGGPVLLARRTADGLQVANLIPWGTPDIADLVATLHAGLRAQLERQQAGMALQPIGSRLFHRPDQVEEFVQDCWPELALPLDFLDRPMFDYVLAPDGASRAHVLRACPDLARPHVEVRLGYLAAHGEKLAPLAVLARQFVDRARREGVDAAQRAEDEATTPIEDLRVQAPDLADAALAFLRADPQALDDAALARADQLAHTLLARDLPVSAADLWCHLGDLYRKRHGTLRAEYLERAIDAYTRSLPLMPAADVMQRWRTRLNLCACLDMRVAGTRMANIDEALRFAHEAEQLATELPAEARAESAMEVALLHTRSISGDAASHLADAREALDRAVELARGTSLALITRFNRALVDVEDLLDTSGRRLAAGIAVLRSLADPQHIDALQPSHQQNLLQTLAVALARQAGMPAHARPADTLDEALALAAQAQAMAESTGSPYEAALLARLRARMAADRLHHERATLGLPAILALLDQAGTVFTADVAPYEYARNETMRAGVLREWQRTPAGLAGAIRGLRNAGRILTPEADPDSSRRVHATLGRLLAQAGRWPQAATAFSVACEASERLWTRTETSARRHAETEPNAEIHALHIDALSRQQATAGSCAATRQGWAVLQAMERGRARLFLDMMGLRPLAPQAGMTGAELAREQALIDALQWTLEGAAADDAPTADRLRAQREARHALDALWDEWAASGEAGRRHVALRRSAVPDTRALRRLATQLGPRRACLCLFVTGTRLVAAWLGHDAAPKLHAMDLDAAQLRARLLAPFERAMLDEHAAPADHRWMDFGEALFAPFAAQLQGLDALVLVPHGPLHGLPLHALNVVGQPLIRHVAVSYAPSLAVLGSLMARPRPAALPGSPFIGSHADDLRDQTEFEAEAQAVAQLHRAAPRRQVGRAQFLRGIQAAPLVHLACHGAYDAADPLQSRLLLADGPLTAAELLPVPLRCELATLSACDTGRQSAPQGDELLGLARALLQAGAASVLVALWRVYSDSTLRWMTLFHQAWAAPPGQAARSRAAAFRAATLALRAEDADPRAWAAFMLTGDAR